MAFSDRLRKARENIGMTQIELAGRLGLRNSTVCSWESGRTKPDVDMFERICAAMDIPAGQLVPGPFPSNKMNHEFTLTARDVELIERYRTLGEGEKAAVDVLLSHYYQTSSLSEKKSADRKPVLNVIPGRLSRQSAAAGFGTLLSDEDFEPIKVSANHLTKRADFYVPVSGDSMEPKYRHGDILIIEDTSVESGDIGLFTQDGNGYVKKLGKGELFSLNPNYDPIPMHEDIICNGKVIGVLNPDWIINE